MEMLALPGEVVGESPEVFVEGVPLKRRRTMSARSSLLATKTKEVRFALGNRVAFSRVPKTLEEAASLISELSQGLDLDKVCEDLGLSRYTLLRHAVHLDMALDSMVKEDIYERRLSGNFLGVTIATDESPPDTPRFAGLRFQSPTSTWASSRTRADGRTSKTLLFDRPPSWRISASAPASPAQIF